MSRCIVSCLGGIAVALGLLVPQRADGAPGSWPSDDLNIGSPAAGDVAIVPLQAPSAEHPEGTIVVFTRPTLREGPDAEEASRWIAAYEWDLAIRKVIRRKWLGRTTPTGGALRAERVGDELFVLAGCSNDTCFDSEETVLFSVDASLEVHRREVIGDGTQASLAVSSRFVVTAVHEKHAPWPKPLTPSGEPGPADRALRVIVRDRASDAVLANHLFVGDELLYTDIRSSLTQHAMTIIGDRGFFSMEGNAKAVVAAVELPSLRTVRTIRFEGFGQLIPAPIYPVGSQLYLATPDGARVLTRDLDVVRHDPASSSSGAAGEDCLREAKAWRTLVALCGGKTIDGEGGPVRLATRRAAP